MKRKIKIFKLFLGLLILISLYSFTIIRNSKRKIKKIEVNFINAGSNYFLNQKLVDDIVNKGQENIYDQTIEKLDLKKVEEKINYNPYVDSAEVNKGLQGVIYFNIKTRNPIARIRTDKNEFYISDKGEKMPLSSLHTPVVNMIYGNVKDEELVELSKLVNFIKQDKLLSSHIISIVKIRSQSYNLIVNDKNFYIELGSLDNFQKKIRNLRLFYNQYLDYVGTGEYEKISLKFINQVVATKRYE